MKIADAAALRAIDAFAIQAGTPGIQLMERAALGVAELALKILQGIQKPSIIVVCGKGNNGGDGLAAARILSRRKIRVTCLLLFPQENFRGDARLNFRRLKKTSVKVIEKAFPDFGKFDLIIDAIFGTGFSGRPEGRVADCIRAINFSKRPVLAIDIPSGVDCSTGAVEGEAVAARATVAMGVLTLGHFFYPGRQLAGARHVHDLQYPVDSLKKFLQGAPTLIDRALSREGIPPRRGDEDKHQCGRVLVVAGSIGMTGAAALCAHAALKSGAGLVTLCIPKSLNAILEVKLTEEMTYPLEDRGSGHLSERHADEILGLLKKYDVLVLGPGLSRHPSTGALARRLALRSSVPVILDADGLFAFGSLASALKQSKSKIVITPHAGEFKRLTGHSVPAGPARIALLKSVQARLGIGIVLKGGPTLVAFSPAEIYLNPTGNPGMATAGTGDVLAGLIGGLYARGKHLKKAILTAVFLHGTSGDCAARERGENFLTAQNLIDFLPPAFREILD